jgi:hypothetical protein
MILPVIFVTDPVPTEGWVRTIYASLLLSVTAPFIFLFLAAFGSTRGRWTILATISFVFLLALPSGMMLHHPWNYIAFFSPFYWSGWAWVIASPVEAVMYGSISAGVTAAGSIIFYRCIPVTES